MKLRNLSLACGLIVTTILVTIGINLHTVHPTSAKISDKFDIAKACNTAHISEGFSQVKLSQSLTIRNASLTISVPCEIKLVDGATLSIYNSELVTDRLVILNDSSNPVPSQISIESSKLESTNGGLFIRFQYGGDISVKHSAIDYPLSVSFAISDKDQDAKLDVETSTIRSNGPSSEGIVLVSTVKGRFVNDSFSTSAEPHAAILSAPDCQMIHDSGTLPKCVNQ